jgi:hypothetical protein
VPPREKCGNPRRSRMDRAAAIYLPAGQGSVKVSECLVHGLVMPSRGRTGVASRALQRRAAAMLR